MQVHLPLQLLEYIPENMFYLELVQSYHVFHYKKNTTKKLHKESALDLAEVQTINTFKKHLSSELESEAVKFKVSQLWRSSYYDSVVAHYILIGTSHWGALAF